MVVIDVDHLVGTTADMQIPQVLPLASRMNPLSPQAVPHEFLARQKSVSIAVSSTMWFRAVPQLLKMPLL